MDTTARTPLTCPLCALVIKGSVVGETGRLPNGANVVLGPGMGVAPPMTDEAQAETVTAIGGAATGAVAADVGGRGEASAGGDARTTVATPTAVTNQTRTPKRFG
jgi:hypothetical protein